MRATLEHVLTDEAYRCVGVQACGLGVGMGWGWGVEPPRLQLGRWGALQGALPMRAPPPPP
jgi:hypothetical protein